MDETAMSQSHDTFPEIVNFLFFSFSLVGHRVGELAHDYVPALRR